MGNCLTSSLSQIADLCRSYSTRLQRELNTGTFVSEAMILKLCTHEEAKILPIIFHVMPCLMKDDKGSPAKEYVNFLAVNAVPKAMTLKEIQPATRQDKLYNAYPGWFKMEHGTRSATSKISEQVRAEPLHAKSRTNWQWMMDRTFSWRVVVSSFQLNYERKPLPWPMKVIKVGQN